MPIVILFVLCVFYALFYFAYKVIVIAANNVLESNLRREIIDGEIGEKGAKFSFKVKDWFTWNVQTNNEKGTAGGNIKINFPIKSALGLAVVCLILSGLCLAFPITSFLIPLILFSFAAFYFLKWWKALGVVKSLENWYEQTEVAKFAKKQLARTQSQGMIAGICKGLNEYTGINTGIFRGTFVITTFFGGAGFVAYGFLWFVLPNKN